MLITQTYILQAQILDHSMENGLPSLIQKSNVGVQTKVEKVDVGVQTEFQKTDAETQVDFVFNKKGLGKQ